MPRLGEICVEIKTQEFKPSSGLLGHSRSTRIDPVADLLPGIGLRKEITLLDLVLSRHRHIIPREIGGGKHSNTKNSSAFRQISTECLAAVSKIMHGVNSEIRSRLRVARLPAMPQILLKLIEKCQADDAGMNVLADLVAKDPGMASKVLGIANSSAFYRSGRRASLEQSLTNLGTDTIKTLVINESVFQVFNHFTHSNGTDLRCFWKHSLMVAVMARDIAEKINYPNVEEAYLAGLLHDVGRLALLSQTDKEFAYLFFARDDDTLCGVEHSLLNISHTEAGAWLADQWNFDSFLSDSLLYHHESVARIASAHPLVRIILLAHRLSLNADNDPAVLEAGSLCGIEAPGLEQISKDSNAKVRKFADMLGIDLSGADELTVPKAGWEIAGLIAGVDENGLRVPAVAASQETPSQPQDAARRQLVDEVRNVVLTTRINQSFAEQPTNGTALLNTVTRSARILFDFVDLIALRTDAAGKTLVGVPCGEHQQRLAEFSIPLSSRGRIAEAAEGHHIAILEAEGDGGDVAEAQLRRLLGSEALVCLPLTTSTSCHGVLIGGVAAWQIPDLRGRERFLKSFGEQAALCIVNTSGERSSIASKADSPDSLLDDYKQSTRGIVHEVNNALSIMKNYLGVLDGKLEKKQLAASEVSILHAEIDRVGQIIKGLSDPNSRAEGGISEVNRVIREVGRLFRESESLPATVSIIEQTLDVPCEISVSPTILKQILINLIKNAIEALPGAGEIQVLNNGQVNRDGQLFTELCVRDNGPGIPPAVMASLFAPVQTTKGEGHQGIGLSIVHGLVKKSQGLITCRSNGRGTAFEILFPIHKHL